MCVLMFSERGLRPLSRPTAVIWGSRPGVVAPSSSQPTPPAAAATAAARCRKVAVKDPANVDNVKQFNFGAVSPAPPALVAPPPSEPTALTGR